MRSAWLVGVAAMLATTVARADAIPHRVRVERQGSTALFVVRLDLQVAGPVREDFMLDLPRRAAVTSGEVADAKGSHGLALTDSSRARQLLDTLSDAPPAKDMAALVELNDSGYGQLLLQVLSPRDQTLAVELHLSAPTCFDRDTRYVAIPDSWLPALDSDTRRKVPTKQRASAIAKACGLEDDGDPPTWIGLPADELASRPSGDRIGVTSGWFSKGGDGVARIELAISRTLSVVPDDLHTVFVVDASRSMDLAQRDATRAIIASYLAKAPRSSAQVVTFARTASPLLEAWGTASTDARTIDERLEHLVARNGSELQPALHEAGRLLQQVRGTRRVVILTDERVADRVGKLPTNTLARELPPNTLVHVVAVGATGRGLTRDDDVRWGALAASTAGIGMRSGSVELDALPLVRPISLDHVRIADASWQAVSGEHVVCDDVLREGTSCRWWARHTQRGPAASAEIPSVPVAPVAPVEIEGMVWGRPWRRTIAFGARNDLAVIRELRYLLGDDDPLTVAAFDVARAVNPRWSLVARWGGDGGYAEAGGGGGTGWGTICGCGRFGTIGHGSGTGTLLTLPPLRDQLATAVARCAQEGVAIELMVETTRDEIVDVGVDVRSRHGRPLVGANQVASCAREAVWSTNVRMDAEHATTRISY